MAAQPKAAPTEKLATAMTIRMSMDGTPLNLIIRAARIARLTARAEISVSFSISLKPNVCLNLHGDEPC
jgi:hypothetical protein